MSADKKIATSHEQSDEVTVPCRRPVGEGLELRTKEYSGATKKDNVDVLEALGHSSY